MLILFVAQNTKNPTPNATPDKSKRTTSAAAAAATTNYNNKWKIRENRLEILEQSEREPKTKRKKIIKEANNSIQ